MKTKLIMLLLVPLYISACASAPPVKKDDVAASAEQPVKQEAPIEKGIVSPVADVVQDALASQQQDMQKKSVYFDFDRYEIKPEFRTLIQQHADVIKAGTSPVTLEGNADERGSSEYNLALGNKRANTVRNALEVSGVKNSQINVVSFGEEKPRSACHEEKCWSENRRVDFKLSPVK